MKRSGDTQPLSLPSPSGAAAVRGKIVAPFAPAKAGDGPTTELSALLAPRKRRSRFGQIRRWLVSLTVLVLLAPPLLGVSLLGAVYWQARTDETRPVDAVVILGTAQYNGRPSPVLRARLDHALRVYEAGIAPLIVVTGGKEQGDAFTEAEASQEYLVTNGVPEDAILLENRGRDSWQSMQGVARLLEQRQLSRILLVSDGFHLLRLKKMAHDLGLTAFATAATRSPIRQGSANEFTYMVREVGGIAKYIWDTR